MGKKTCVFLTKTVLKEHSRIELYNLLHGKLEDNGVTLWIVAYHEGEGDQNLNESRLIPNVTCLSKKGLAIVRWLKLISLLARLNPDHFLIGGYGHVENWLAWGFALCTGKPSTLWTGAGPTTTIDRGRAKAVLKRLFVRHIDNFIAYGTKAKQYLQTLGVQSERVYVSKNVSDTSFFSVMRTLYVKTPEFEKCTGKRQCPMLIYAGRLEKSKGINLLIEQLSKFSLDRYFLYVIGKGSLAGFVQDACEKEIVNGVFGGYLGREDLAKRLIEADIYICPTLNDPFTRSLSEALACGCFSLSSVYDDASVDLVQSGVNGFVFDPLNPGDFSQKLSNVLAHTWKRPSRDFIASTQSYTTNDYAETIFNAIVKALATRSDRS